MKKYLSIVGAALMGAVTGAVLVSPIGVGVIETERPSVKLEEKSLDGKKWYVLDLEGKVKPGDYMLTTEESDVCSILSGDFKIEPGPYKLMLIEACGTLFLN